MTDISAVRRVSKDVNGASSIAALYPEDIVDMWIADGRELGEPEVFLTFEPHRECPCANCVAAFEDEGPP